MVAGGLSRSDFATIFRHSVSRPTLHACRPHRYCPARTMTNSITPILACDHAGIEIKPSSPPSHRLQSPSFTIPTKTLTNLEVASSHLHAGRTVAVPTETVYGLAGASTKPEAVQRIYQIKQRPSDNPLIIHVSSLDMLHRLLPPGYVLSRLYLALIDAFWPGPLTLLFPSPSPPPPPAPQTNAIRMPSHPLALALIHHSDLPLSAPSANSSGRPSPTRAQHVFNDLNGKEGLGCILDGGDCGVGVESTVVNALAWREGGGGSVDVLRPGGLGVEDIQRVVTRVDGAEGKTEMRLHGKPWMRNAVASSSRLPQPDQSAAKLPPSTPGMKYRHYSPRVPVYLLLPSNTFPKPTTTTPSTVRAIMEPIIASLQNGRRPRLGLLHYEGSALSRRIAEEVDGADFLPVSLGADSTSAAQRLFSGMLSLEGGRLPVQDDSTTTASAGVDAIFVEGCSDEGLGLAVMERVGKAVGGGGKSGELGNGEGESSSGRFWVEV